MAEPTDNDERRPDGRLFRWDMGAWLLAFGLIIGFQAVRGAFPGHWMILDNLQRLSALLVLALSPRLRSGLRLAGRPSWIDALLTAALLGIAVLCLRHLNPALVGLLGKGHSFAFPPYAGAVERWIDLTWGLALVAYQEEVVFTAALARLLRPYCGAVGTVVLASVIFAANHWTQDWATILTAGVIHLPFVVVYLWRGRLLPLVAAHWLADIDDFG